MSNCKPRALLAILCCTALAAQQPETLRGRVVDVHGAPIEGVTVSAQDGRTGSETAGSVATNEDGRYELQVVPDQALLYFVADGYARVRLQHRGARVRVETVALPAAVMITGRVRAPGGGPLAGAKVTARDRAPADSRIHIGEDAVSDERGFFHLRHVPASLLELTLTADGRRRSRHQPGCRPRIDL